MEFIMVFVILSFLTVEKFQCRIYILSNQIVSMSDQPVNVH